MQKSEHDTRQRRNPAQLNFLNVALTAFIEKDLDSILAKVQMYCDKICKLNHPQAALLLLRKCNGVCRVAHVLKVLAIESVERFQGQVDLAMMDAVQNIAGFPITENQRLQAVLPVRFGGLGIYSAEALSPVARSVSAWNFSCTGRDLTGYPEAQAANEPPMEDLATICELLPGKCVMPRVWLAEGLVPEEADPSWLSQKWWSLRVQEQQRETLAAKSTGRDVSCHSASTMRQLTRGSMPSPRRLWDWRSRQPSSRSS